MKYSLKRQFLLTAITLFSLVCCASIALFYTASQTGFYIEHMGKSQLVYSRYRAVSDFVYQKLSAMGEIVEENSLHNLPEIYRDKNALRTALDDVQKSINDELGHVGHFSREVELAHFSELEHFKQIERFAEDIIKGNEKVQAAVESNQPDVAKVELAKLRSHDVEGRFFRLIDAALSDELIEVRETQLMAQELHLILTRLLSLIFICFICSGAYFLFSTWRGLTGRLQIFENATAAYQTGDFSVRVPNVVEDEFSGLALALNTMAREVETQRENEKNTQEYLEATITSRTQQLRASNQKLETISETRKQFLADISHELRTPLTIIQGEADLALRDKATTSEQFCTALLRIKEQTVHTTRFVQDLLFVARAEDGKAPIHKYPVSIVPLVLDICEDFGVIIEERNIDIISHCPERDLVAYVDASKIKQVVTILLDNAVRYSYSNSSIEVTIQDKNTHLVVEIKDFGIGLKCNEASQVFSRFYRGTEGSGKASGTGLGLPVAKAIVEAHDGTISLQGDSGGGSIATFSLPLAASEDIAS